MGLFGSPALKPRYPENAADLFSHSNWADPSRNRFENARGTHEQRINETRKKKQSMQLGKNGFRRWRHVLPSPKLTDR